MISSILIVLIAIAALRKNPDDKFIYLCFAALCGFLSLIDNSISNEYFCYYYLMAAVLDYTTIKIISKLTKPTVNSIILQSICLSFIVINMIGFAFYELYIEKIYYNSLCFSLYLTTLMAVSTGIGDGVGINRQYFNNNFIPRFNFQSYHSYQTNKAEKGA